MSKASRSPAAAVFVAMGILLSRISGLIRARIFAHYLGNSLAAGSFNAALRIPNFLQNLFGEGVLSASFIPVYSKLVAQDDQELARRVAGVVLSVLALAMSGFVLLGVWLTPAFVDLVAPGFEGETRVLTIQLVRILFPGIGILVLSAWCLGILNSHRKFFLSYVATVFWNLAMIVALIVFGRSENQDALAVDLAWASVAGSFLQLGVQIPFVLKYGGRLRPSFALKADLALQSAREVFKNLGPVFFSRGVVQLSAYIDGMIASFLGASAVSSLAYAQTIYLLPVSLFGMSVAAAELPAMSSSLGNQDEVYAKLRGRLAAGLRNIAFFVVPSVAAFLILGKSVVAALYQSGVFGPNDTLYVWYILMGSVVGLLAATWGRLYSSTFYALRDTKTPLKFAIVRVFLTATLGVLFAFPLRPTLTFFLVHVLMRPLPALQGIDLGLGAVGLTASAGVAGWVEFLLLKRALGHRIGAVSVPLAFLVKIWGSALGAATFGLFADTALPRLRFFRYDFHPLAVIAAYGALYLSLTLVLQVEEVRRIKKFF